MDVLSPEAFRAHLRTVTPSKSTAQKYADAARRFLQFCDASGVRLERAPRGIFQSFVTWLGQRTDLAPASIHVMYSGARKYVDWRRDAGEDIPVFSKPALPQVISKEPVSLTAPELSSYLEACTAFVPEPSQMALILLPYCGLRSDEHVSVKLTDLILKRDNTGTTRVTIRVVGKGSKFRYVPVLGPVYSRLGHYLARWRAGQGESPWLFPSPVTGKSHIQAKTMREWMVDVRRHAGIGPEVTPHTMRRTYATALRARGYSEATIADILGHASVDTTRKHYFAVSSPDELWQRLREQEARA